VLAKIVPVLVPFNVQTIAKKRGRCLPGKVVLLPRWTISISHGVEYPKRRLRDGRYDPPKMEETQQRLCGFGGEMAY